jgi:hypothetical protein
MRGEEGVSIDGYRYRCDSGGRQQRDKGLRRTEESE